MPNYHHLTYEQRCQIYALKKRDFSLSLIAVDLGVSKSTVCREIKRNSGEKGYRFKQAQRFSEKRRTGQYLKMTAELQEIIESKILIQWSPQQISGWLKVQKVCRISHERIYQYIWEDKKKGGSLYKNLRHKAKKYHRRASAQAGRGLIPGRVDIDLRPEVVEAKERIGDWELDTIIGAKHKGAIVSIVDRASKLMRIKKVSHKKKDVVGKALREMLDPKKDLILTLTADNGKEFAEHQAVSRALKADFFFAKPYHAWQRGLSEHTNGLVRQYIPKKTDLNTISDEDVQIIEKLINNRPRAVLNFKTPMEIYQDRAGKDPTVALQT